LYYAKADSISEIIGDEQNQAFCSNLIGEIYYEMGEYNKALNKHIKAYNLYEKIGDKKGISDALNYIGTMYDILREPEKALDALQRSLNIRLEIGNTHNIADSYNNIGVFYYYQEEYDKALDNYLKAMNTLPDSIRSTKSNYFNNIGEIYCIKKDYKLASEYFQKSIAISRAKGDDYHTAITMRNIGSVYVGIEMYNEGLKYLNQSLEIALKINSKLQVKEIYDELCRTYQLIRDFENALKYKTLSAKINDSIFNEQHLREIAEMNTKYETVEREKKIAILNQKEERSRNMRNSLIAISAFFILLAFVLLFRYIEKKKANVILQNQRNELKIKNEEISQQKKEIEIKSKHITDSINYASRIQAAILPSEKFISEILTNFFVFFKPRDIVSGDFYWVRKVENKILATVADCTGHGVPGAFMSMLGVSILNEIVRKKEITQANHVLEELRNQVKTTLGQTGKQNEQKDGMDMVFCVIDTETKKLEFAGANNSAYIIRSSPNAQFEPVNSTNEIIRLKGNHQPIGIHLKEHPFTNQEFQLQKGDTIYMSTDGYIDQFGGQKGDRFKTRRYKDILLSVQEKPLVYQKKHLDEVFTTWKGRNEQIDDVLIMAIRI
jgi:serine phosphatase RsbU (regulator of sigma subunit)/Tfp pilus assembly protein PilF